MNEPAGITWLEAGEFFAEARKRFRRAEVVLDIGAGIKPQTFLKPRVQLCIEPHPTYVRHLVELSLERPELVPLHATWEQGLAAIPDRSVDTVFALDFIEHLEKEDGRRFLDEAIRVARGQVILYTPYGLYPQDYDASSGDTDRWGLDGARWQCHRSGWLPEDFGEGWDLLCCRDYYRHDQFDQVLETPVGAIWAIHGPRDVRADDPPFLQALLEWVDRAHAAVRARIRRML